jgi:predicted DNA-binding transcriptional regulator YafY
VVYLIGRAREYEDIRHLALHRMSAAKLLEAPCHRPTGFDLHRYAREQEELAYPVGRGTIKLEALFDREAAIHLDERPLARDQRLTPQEQGRTLLRATVRDTLALRWWLLGFGDKVTVLAPKPLREDFKQIAQRMARAYGGG